MVLVPFVSVPEPLKTEFANDFSRHTDTPYMNHLKREMSKILNNPSGGNRETSLLYNKLLQKYRRLKDEQHDDKGGKVSGREFRTPSKNFKESKPESEALWWDDAGEPAPASDDDEGGNQREAREYEITDDEAEDDDNASMRSAPEQRISGGPMDFESERAVRKRNSDAIDDQLDLMNASKHARVIIRRQRRRNAIDSPPNKLTQFRKVIGRPAIIRKRTEPGEYTIIDHRFKNSTRKREASKPSKGKKTWLGRTKTYFTPPSKKQPRFDEDDDSETGGQWDQLAN